jgi:hypothetical protein
MVSSMDSVAEVDTSESNMCRKLSTSGSSGMFVIVIGPLSNVLEVVDF